MRMQYNKHRLFLETNVVELLAGRINERKKLTLVDYRN